jgi:hypothetical protein
MYLSAFQEQWPIERHVNRPDPDPSPPLLLHSYVGAFQPVSPHQFFSGIVK